MESAKMIVLNGNKLGSSVDQFPFARSFLVEALEKAIEENTVMFLGTGSGKTLIAIMLLRRYAHLLQKPSLFTAVFLVPEVALVPQQAKAVKDPTDLKVVMYGGEMGIAHWDAASWGSEQDKHEVLIMTPAILLDGLRHSFFELDMIKVLILDECHHARGKHPYACIMKEFYHYQLHLNNFNLPRIFGMTASLVRNKGSTSIWSCWKNDNDLMNLMNSKVYTCLNKAVLAESVGPPTPCALFESLAHQLAIINNKHERSLGNLGLKESMKESAKKRISKLFSTFMFCSNNPGLWLAFKVAGISSCHEMDIFYWEQLDLSSEEIVEDFNKDAYKVIFTYILSDGNWSVGDDLKADTESGFVTTKVTGLIGSLLEYRHIKNLRCIVFVEMVITTIILQKLLSWLLPKLSGWKVGCTAGTTSEVQSQSRREQSAIFEEFQRGMVNILVATGAFEEGLDIQGCNLVIRFDSSAAVCSFIQSQAHAGMQNSDFLLMVKSGDDEPLSQVLECLNTGNIMRKEPSHHASLPCVPLESSSYDEELYCVESTRAIVTLSSSVELLNFYCSQLPHDGYFKPTPRCCIDEETQICTVYLPKSCPIQSVSAQGNIKILKQIACLEACKKLHQNGALTDNLVPQIIEEEAAAQDGKMSYDDEQATYFPPELVNQFSNDPVTTYHCYIFELEQKYKHDITVQDVVLAVRSELESDIENINFDLQADRGTITVCLKYVGVIRLTADKVLMCRQFQITLLRVLVDGTVNKVKAISDGLELGNNQLVDYLLLPCTNSHEMPSIIDWECLSSVFFSYEHAGNHMDCFFPGIQTKSGFVCRCALKNSLVYTPHNGQFYCITSISDKLNGNSLLNLKNGSFLSYKEYYHQRHGLELQFEQEPLLKGKRLFLVQNCLQKCRKQKKKDPTNTTVELPPELCIIYMSPISIGTIYSFSFIPSIMHRMEALLIAANLKRMHLDCCIQNAIPTSKVLEAITTKHCQEIFHLESLETLGDSFLKYATTQQLFKTYQNLHVGILGAKKDRIVSNAALCKLGCDSKIPGFIRNECFDPKKWIIAGDQFGSHAFNEEILSTTRKIYVRGSRKLKKKTIADVVEALIGAYLSTYGETAALLFMDWLGIKVDFVKIPYKRDFPAFPERHVNVNYLESILNYSFHDSSLLVEALTHGSYMLPEIPRCYQRLEFLGESVLDYLVTMYLYHKYPGMSPGQLTDLRSASVNNDCYAQSAVKSKLHQHILYTSQELHRDIAAAVNNFENEKLSFRSALGWESESSFPKVLGDVIESLAGAILVDSDYNKEVVFRSIRHLMEPLSTLETMKLHPVRELNELCQKEHYNIRRDVESHNAVASVTIEVEANGVIHKHTSSSDKKNATRLACKEVLKSLKRRLSRTALKRFSCFTVAA